MIDRNSELLEDKSQKIMNLPIEVEKKTKENVDLKMEKDITKQEYQCKIARILSNTLDFYEYHPWSGIK